MTCFICSRGWQHWCGLKYWKLWDWDGKSTREDIDLQYFKEIWRAVIEIFKNRWKCSVLLSDKVYLSLLWNFVAWKSILRSEKMLMLIPILASVSSSDYLVTLITRYHQNQIKIIVCNKYSIQTIGLNKL